MSVRPLSRDLQKIAEAELNEDSNKVQDDINHIKEWLENKPHFKIRTDEQLFLSFLRGCKFNLNLTREKLNNYYSVRGLLPEYFSNRDPLLPEIQDFLNVGAIIPLPNTENSVGPRIHFFRLEQCDPAKMTIANLFKTYLMMIDILLQEDDNSAVSGIHIICDYKNFSPTYMLQLTPTYFKNAFHCMESAYPMRIKRIDCINVPPIFEAILKIMNLFMSDKLKERLHACTCANFEAFHKSVPQMLLPNEYGGQAGLVDEISKNWKNKMEGYRKWLMEEEKYGTIESLRSPNEVDDSEKPFGIEGTFKKLNLD